jgi:crotonobetainyl-CoA:carnitine CoA-transferase CaiB-like acyl-CoA transferase
MKTPTDVLEPAPRAGQNTVEILKGLGLSSARIDELTSSGAARVAG